MADDEMQSRFAPNGALEPDVLGELQSMARLHDISAEDLYFKWESYCIKMDVDAQAVTLDGVRGLKQSIQDELEKSQRRVQLKSERKSAPTPRPKAAGRAGDVFGMLDGLVPSTPGSARLLNGNKTPGSGGLRRRLEMQRDIPSSPAAGLNEQLKSMNLPATSFADRQHAGEVVEILNEELPPAQAPTAPFPEPRIKLTAASDQKKTGYKPLAMKLSEASEILDDRIDDFIDLVREHHDLEDSAFGNAATASTTEVVAVGRIASDSLEGKLNAASIVLETSRRTGRGLRVPLKLDAVRTWSFFPGQIVALRGSNITGDEFIVKEILEVPLLPSAASSLAALEAHREKLRGDPDAMDADSDPAPLNIIYAAGPYTADDNLDYEPLQALCNQAADTCADALVLTGPFLDVDHPLIATGDFDLPEEASYDPDTANMNTVFKHVVAPALNRLASANPHLTVILVPSVRDVLDKHVSWPQDTIPRRELGLPKSVRIVSNPMTLSMNEVVVGLSSQDVLYELRSEEVSRGAPSGGLMRRLSRHLVEQRHYFPVFPPTDRSRLPRTGTEDGLATGSMLDVSYLKLGEMVSIRPDVLLVPSSLPPFATVVESVVAINPGSLSKRRGPGTYARMTLYPPPLDGEVVDGLISHKVFDRARVEIVRI
ncbi:DNA polymerase alpha subunit B N-terminal domain-containing protein [Trichoderma novae-zelandiae]